jgi:hypothetical protein
MPNDAEHLNKKMGRLATPRTNMEKRGSVNKFLQTLLTIKDQFRPRWPKCETRT